MAGHSTSNFIFQSGRPVLYGKIVRAVAFPAIGIQAKHIKWNVEHGNGKLNINNVIKLIIILTLSLNWLVGCKLWKPNYF